MTWLVADAGSVVVVVDGDDVDDDVGVDEEEG